MSYLVLVTGAYRDFSRQYTCAVTAVRLNLFFVSLGNGADRGDKRCSTRASWIMTHVLPSQIDQQALHGRLCYSLGTFG